MNNVVLRAEQLSKEYTIGPTATSVLKGVSLGRVHGRTPAAASSAPSGAGEDDAALPAGGPGSAELWREVWLGGDPLFQMGDEALSRLRNRRLGFVFQYHHLLPDLDAAANVALPLRVGGLATGPARARAVALLQGMGLSHRIDHKPGELSGGEQQSRGGHGPGPGMQRSPGPAGGRAPPATWTSRTAWRCLSCCARPPTKAGRPW